MKLTDLDPRWYSGLHGEPRAGITFRCPHCPESGQRLGVAVKADGASLDPDPDDPKQHGVGQHVWTMTGDSFENLSLSPSVDASRSGHWHGFITNGEIR